MLFPYLRFQPLTSFQIWNAAASLNVKLYDGSDDKPYDKSTNSYYSYCRAGEFPTHIGSFTSDSTKYAFDYTSIDVTLNELLGTHEKELGF